MMTSTWSTSASLRTALTASPGVALLSANEASTLRPMMPPFALISSTASVAPHRTPSPVIAAGPLIAEAKPMRMGGACAPTDNAPAEIAASTRVTRAVRMKGLLLSNHHREVLAGAGERARAGRRHLDGVLDLHAAPAVLVVGRLDAEHHAGLERGVRRRVDRRRVVGLEPDPVPDVVSLIVGQAALARDADGEVEQPAHRHAGLHRRDRGTLAREDRRVVARLLVARRAQHGRARDVGAIGAPEAAEVEAHEVARTQRAVGGIDVGQRRALADGDHGEEGLRAPPQHLVLVDARGLTLGDAGLQ